MILADYVGKLVGPQFVRERPRRVAIETGGREKARSVRLWTRTHPLNMTEICWPPRTMVTCHRRPPALAIRSSSADLAIL